MACILFTRHRYNNKMFPRLLLVSVQVALLCWSLPFGLVAQSPSGGTVASGTATIAQSGNTTNINQSSSSAVINWQSFSIGSNSTVSFIQPSTTAVTLNRVTGNASSVISGVLKANGNVFLINANGILMNSTARISTGGFVASTLDISDSDFKSGKYVFTSSSSSPASIVNLGTITTSKDSGYIALLGGSVSNQGTITATKGTAALAAGDQITLNFSGNSLVGVTVGEGVLDALVENKQAIYANGGTVIMTAKAADDLLSAQVNNSGLIQAQTVDDLKGNITLFADGGTTSISGTLDASAPSGGNGGKITTSGTTVTVADGATVTTQAASAKGSSGLWTIDSYGFTVAASGGNMTATELNSVLEDSSVAISSSTNSSNGIDSSVNINTPLNWTGNTTLSLSAADYVNVNDSITATGANAGLTLKAGTDIEVNAPITLSGKNAALAMIAGTDIDINDAITLSGENAALSMNYGGDYNILTSASYAGAVLGDDGVPVANTDTSGGTYGSITLSGDNASLNINGNAYTLIHSMSQLDALDSYNATTGSGSSSTVSGYYALAGNLDASGTTYTGSLINSFIGTLAGLGHTINDLTIDSSKNNVGLIGLASNAVIRDLGLTNVNIASTGDNVGALLGSGNATLSNDYSSGQVTGYSLVGGLVGYLQGGTVSYDYSSANVTSTESTDLINGQLGWAGLAGGLIGYDDGGSISNSDATGTVTSVNGPVGGLVGYLRGSSIDLSYATGKVTETTMNSTDGAYSSAGGLVGDSTGDIYNSFATGDVSGYAQVGGLVGLEGIQSAATDVYTIKNSYATGDVSSYGWIDGSEYSVASGAGTGGLVGVANSTEIINSFATGDVTSYYNQPYTEGGSTNGYVGGLVGLLEYGTVTGSYASGDVTITSSYLYGAGGLVGGSNFSTVKDSFAYGDVSGYYYVGGLVGEMLSGDGVDSIISGSAAYGDVSGSYDVGGIVGYVSDINGSAGDDHGTITDVVSYGTVTASGNYAGGIAGFDAYGTIDNASSYGDIQGAADVGSLVGGGYDPTVTNSQSYGGVTSDATLAEQSKLSMSAGASQTQSSTFVTNNTEDSEQASGSLGDQVQDSILIDDPSRFSATVKTVVVDGVEYQVQSDDDTKKQEQK
jgi:filamentous hemagglutinin family protein